MEDFLIENMNVVMPVVATVLVGFIFLVWFRQVEKIRKKRISKEVDFAFFKENARFKKSLKKARDKAARNLRLRFSIIRFVILGLFLMVLGMVLLVPYWDTVPAKFISAAAAAATLILGIAAKPFIENLIAGIVITLSRQFRTGDTVIVDDKYGTVENISPTHTTIKIWDWRRYVISNSTMLNKEFVNYSVNYDYIWAYAEFWVAPDSDMDKVEKIALKSAEEVTNRMMNEPVSFWVMGAEKDAIKCWIAGWTDDPGQAWMFKSETLKKTLKGFKKAGIKTQKFGIK